VQKTLFPILSVFLALVVLLSTTTITINKHFCHGKLVDTVILKESKGCNTADDSTSKKPCKTVKKHCCDDQQLVFEGLDHVQFEKYVPKVKQPNVLVAVYFQKHTINFTRNLKYVVPSYFNYEPPPLVRPIYQLDEVFLI